MNSVHHQRGVTLVELMIAVLIGLFIIAGVGQIYISSRAASNLQERMSNLQENGRFGIFFLQRSLRKAGFPKSSGLSAFTTTPSNITCPMAAAVACTPDTSTATTTATCNGAGAASDQFAVCYQGTTDCLGQNVAAGVVTDFFFISTDAATGVSRLMCRGSGNNTSQPLVDGIENMQVQYGQDTDGDSYANNFVPANLVTDWTQVVAVRVSLLTSTNSNDASAASSVGRVYGDTASDAQTYPVLEQTLPASAVNTGARGRVFTTTIELRNRTP
jgi:type IV pilus assembly protein PilW